jgi:hypothetical protein
MGWFFLVMLIIILIGGLIYWRTLPGQARELEGFIKGMTLPLTDIALTMSPRRLSRANMGGFIGGAPMMVVLVVIVFSAGHRFGLSGISIIGLLILACSAIGVAIACTTNVGPSASELPRVARATRPRTTDYLSSVWIAISIAVCATGLVVAILVLLRNTASGLMNSLLVAIIVMNAVTLAASPVLAHILLSSPQPANDSLQLAWDDAMRAHGLRSVWLAPSAIGVATAFFAINLLYPGVSDLVYLEYVLCFAGLHSWGKLTRPGSRFQRRLWPITPQPVVGSYAE